MAAVATSLQTSGPPASPPRFPAICACAAITAVVAITAAGLLAAINDPRAHIDPRAQAGLWLVQVTALVGVLLGAWALLPLQPPAVTGFALLAVGWLVPQWAAWSWLPVQLRVVALTAAPLAVAGATMIALRWPPAPARWARTVVRIVCLLTALGAIAMLLAYNPFADPLCSRTCEDMPAPLAGLVTSRAAVLITSVLATGAAVLGAVSTLRISGTPGVIRTAEAVGVAALGVWWAMRAVTWGPTHPSLVQLAAPPLSAAIIGVAVCVSALSLLHTRALLNKLVEQLSGADGILDPAQGAVTAIHFSVPGESRWIDDRGVEIPGDPTAARSVVLSDEIGPAVRLTLGRSSGERDVLNGLTAANRLALSNAHLAAVAKTRLTDVQASQRRLIAVSDAERRRIERDLHDGAQQRLVSAAFHLKLAITRVGPQEAIALSAVVSRLGETLAHLRALAHGVFPSGLLDEGLDVALTELAAASDVPTKLELSGLGGPGELPAEIGTAAFAMAAAALDCVQRPGSATVAVISTHHEAGTLTARVDLVAGDGALRIHDLDDVADRVGAVGGRLIVTVLSTARVAVTAVIPCRW